MARLFTSGFEVTSQPGTEWTAPNSGTAATIDTTAVRSGVNGCHITASAGRRLLWARRGASIASTWHWYIRIYIKIIALPNTDSTILTTSDINLNLNVKVLLLATGALRVVDEDGTVGTSSTTLSADGNWHRLEIKIDGSGGAGACAVDLRINGSSEVSATTLDWTQGWDGILFGGALQGETHASGEWYLDDVAINNTANGSQTSWPGAGSVICLFPDSDGEIQEGSRGGTDSGTNWGQVDENPPNDVTDYWTLATDSANINSADRFEVNCAAATGNGPDSDDTITLVHVWIRKRGLTSATGSVVARVKTQNSGTVSEGSTHSTASTSWFSVNSDAAGHGPAAAFYVAPQTASAWTLSELDSLQIGVRSPDATPDQLASTLWATVEYVPVEAGSGNPWYYFAQQ